MIRRVYEQAEKSELVDTVYVATDSDEIFSSVQRFGGNVGMTSSECGSGTDRAKILGLADNDVIVNVQGDQPVLHSECLNDLIHMFVLQPGLKMGTLAYGLNDERDISDPNNVKVIFDGDGFALYFSRAKIPFDRDGISGVQYYKHLGIYAYSYSFLQEFTRLPRSRLENIERLEQLRVLESGHRIQVAVTAYNSPSVDDPADITQILDILRLQQQ